MGCPSLDNTRAIPKVLSIGYFFAPPGSILYTVWSINISLAVYPCFRIWFLFVHIVGGMNQGYLLGPQKSLLSVKRSKKMGCLD